MEADKYGDDDEWHGITTVPSPIDEADEESDAEIELANAEREEAPLPWDDILNAVTGDLALTIDDEDLDVVESVDSDTTSAVGNQGTYQFAIDFKARFDHSIGRRLRHER